MRISILHLVVHTQEISCINLSRSRINTILKNYLSHVFQDDVFFIICLAPSDGAI